MDSLNFMMSSLADLVEGNAPEDMKITEKLVCQEKKRKLLLKKGMHTLAYGHKKIGRELVREEAAH